VPDPRFGVPSPSQFFRIRVGKANYAVGGGIWDSPRAWKSRMKRPGGLVGALAPGRRHTLSGCTRRAGLTCAEFCRREGVSLFNLRRWLGKANRAGEARFVEIEARAIAEHGRYRIGFEGGGWLEVEGGFDEGEVRVLARIVREATRC
jgi:hypothetical protein